MASINGLERYIPVLRAENFSFSAAQINSNSLEISGRHLPHLETTDFPLNDPWSEYLREVIEDLRDQGAFIGTPVTELGIGDGRNVRILGSHPSSVLGVDIERWRVEVAGVNLASDPAFAQTEVELWSGDAVDFLQESQRAGRSLTGWTIMCLPQSPEGMNFADRYDGASNLNTYRSDWEESGLTLNAAVLDNLRAVVEGELKVLTIISDRVPEEVKNSLFLRTGWVKEATYKTSSPIQQDPDTGIAWVSTIDDGGRFHQRVNGSFEPITAVEAELRRRQSLQSGLGRAILNVYHGLSVYQLRSK